MQAQNARLDGIDVARAIALIGMLSVHFGPEDDPSFLGHLYSIPHGRASVLFAVIAGVGISLLSRKADNRLYAQVRLVSYAMLLLPLGLVLDALGHRVAVILHHYAAFFILGAFALRLSTKNLFRVALAALIFGPLIYFQARILWPDALSRHSVSILNSPSQIVQALLWSGPYPLLTWAGPILWGMWLGRQDFKDGRLLAAMVAGGTTLAVGTLLFSDAAMAVVGQSSGITDQRQLLSTSAHSEMPLWLLQAMAAATAIIGACIFLARLAPKILAPLAAMGRMTLSLYVFHILALTIVPIVLTHDTVIRAYLIVIMFAMGCMVAASLWPNRRGPLEAVMHSFAMSLTDRLGLNPRGTGERAGSPS